MALCLLAWRTKSVCEFAKKMVGVKPKESDPVTLLALSSIEDRACSEGGNSGQKLDV